MLVPFLLEGFRALQRLTGSSVTHSQRPTTGDPAALDSANGPRVLELVGQPGPGSSGQIDANRFVEHLATATYAIRNTYGAKPMNWKRH